VYASVCVFDFVLKFLPQKMASIFGRRQKPASSKKETQVSNGSQNGVEDIMKDIMENGTKGVNGESDYHKNGRHSSTFKPQIPPTSSTNSSSPKAPAKEMNSHSNSTKRYVGFFQGKVFFYLFFINF
jgi:hypothetical protein